MKFNFLSNKELDALLDIAEHCTAEEAEAIYEIVSSPFDIGAKKFLSDLKKAKGEAEAEPYARVVEFVHGDEYGLTFHAWSVRAGRNVPLGTFQVSSVFALSSMFKRGEITAYDYAVYRKLLFELRA